MKLLNFFKKKNNSNFNSVKCNGTDKDFLFSLIWTIYGEDKKLYRCTDMRIFDSIEQIKNYLEKKELEFKEMAISKNCCIHFSFKHITKQLVLPNPVTPEVKEEIIVRNDVCLGRWNDGILAATPTGSWWLR